MFLDPEVFNPDSALGVPGLMRAWRAGNVAIANAPGAGVADDKVVYAWVPDLIRYYLDEEPLIPNVPTYRCLYDDERRHVLDNLRELVIKPANESGGYGLVVGDRATDDDLDSVARAIEADPRRWVAQPILDPLHRAHPVRRAHRTPPPRPAPVHPHRPHQLRHPGRADAGGAAGGLAGGQLVPGGRLQGHLGGGDVTPPAR